MSSNSRFFTGKKIPEKINYESVERKMTLSLSLSRDYFLIEADNIKKKEKRRLRNDLEDLVYDYLKIKMKYPKQFCCDPKVS